ncbi:hypothetical protein GF327_00150 [Candidatus Woesearchaeota archaeon]|nr:hypothetical protein [Candidatus Woesearchaeota archaeon]
MLAAEVTISEKVESLMYAQKITHLLASVYTSEEKHSLIDESHVPAYKEYFGLTSNLIKSVSCASDLLWREILGEEPDYNKEREYLAHLEKSLQDAENLEKDVFGTEPVLTDQQNVSIEDLIKEREWKKALRLALSDKDNHKFIHDFLIDFSYAVLESCPWYEEGYDTENYTKESNPDLPISIYDPLSDLCMMFDISSIEPKSWDFNVIKRKILSCAHQRRSPDCVDKRPSSVFKIIMSNYIGKSVDPIFTENNFGLGQKLDEFTQEAYRFYLGENTIDPVLNDLEDIFLIIDEKFKKPVSTSFYMSGLDFELFKKNIAKLYEKTKNNKFARTKIRISMAENKNKFDTASLAKEMAECEYYFERYDRIISDELGVDYEVVTGKKKFSDTCPNKIIVLYDRLKEEYQIADHIGYHPERFRQRLANIQNQSKIIVKQIAQKKGDYEAGYFAARIDMDDTALEYFNNDPDLLNNVQLLIDYRNARKHFGRPFAQNQKELDKLIEAQEKKVTQDKKRVYGTRQNAGSQSESPKKTRLNRPFSQSKVEFEERELVEKLSADQIRNYRDRLEEKGLRVPVIYCISTQDGKNRMDIEYMGHDLLEYALNQLPIPNCREMIGKKEYRQMIEIARILQETALEQEFPATENSLLGQKNLTRFSLNYLEKKTENNDIRTYYKPDDLELIKKLIKPLITIICEYGNELVSTDRWLKNFTKYPNKSLGVIDIFFNRPDYDVSDMVKIMTTNPDPTISREEFFDLGYEQYQDLYPDRTQFSLVMNAYTALYSTCKFNDDTYIPEEVRVVMPYHAYQSLSELLQPECIGQLIDEEVIDFDDKNSLEILQKIIDNYRNLANPPEFFREKTLFEINDTIYSEAVT